MDIKNFFQHILSGNKAVQVPQPVMDQFELEFANPLNPEWTKSSDAYEAVFYLEELEHIARYAANGNRSCLKINLPLDRLPEAVKNAAEAEGELMNAICIDCENQQKYELIVRDAALNRFFLLLTPSGEVTEKEKL